MAALATLAQLEARLGRQISDVDEMTRAEALLDDASAAVRSYTGQYISSASSSERLAARHGYVRLPQRPARSVDDVVNDDALDVPFRWALGSEEVQLDAAFYCPPSQRRVYVTVTYSHGYAVVPDDIVAVTCNIAARSLGVRAEDAAVTSQTITNFSESYGPVGAAGPVGLFSSETMVLDRYRRVGTTAWAVT